MGTVKHCLQTLSGRERQGYLARRCCTGRNAVTRAQKTQCLGFKSNSIGRHKSVLASYMWYFAKLLALLMPHFPTFTHVTPCPIFVTLCLSHISFALFGLAEPPLFLGTLWTNGMQIKRKM